MWSHVRRVFAVCFEPAPRHAPVKSPDAGLPVRTEHGLGFARPRLTSAPVGPAQRRALERARLLGRGAGLLLLALLAALAGLAQAQSTAPAKPAAAPRVAEPAKRGVILQLDEGRAIVDLGRQDGLREGDVVRLRKRYVLVHPVTSAKIEDDLPLGTGRVERVSDRICVISVGLISLGAAPSGGAPVAVGPVAGGPVAGGPVAAGTASVPPSPAAVPGGGLSRAVIGDIVVFDRPGTEVPALMTAAGGQPSALAQAGVSQPGAQSGVSQPGGTQSGVAQSGVAQSGGAQSGGTQSGGTQSGGAQSGGTQSGGTQSGGTPFVVALGCKPCETNAEAMAVHRAWVRALDRDLNGRKGTWLEFLSSHPNTPYKPYVRRELAFLSALLQVPTEREPRVTEYADGKLESLYEGEPLSPAVVLPARVLRHLRGVHLFHRTPGAPVFTRVEMRADGDGYYRATLPPASVRVPGVEYFVETLDFAGKTSRVFASSAAPWRVEVLPPLVKKDERKNRSQLTFSYSWVDYYLSGASNDYFWKLDGAFTYRVDWKALQFFKLGFGYFEGSGGSIMQVRDAAAGGGRGLDTLAFAFVYLEPELVFHELFAILPRLTIGQIDSRKHAGTLDLASRTAQIFGFHAFLRVGKREGTNLLVGGGATQSAGFETQLTLNLGLWKSLPVAFSAIVSNFPVNSEVGVLLRGEVGYRIGDSMEVGVHLGFAARNINHTGLGAGTTLNFKW